MSRTPRPRSSLLKSPDVKARLATLKPRTVNSALFNLAHAYARAADDAWKRLSASGDADFAGPAIMCQSFAIELLLKFFSVAEHPNAAMESTFGRLEMDLRGHRYTDLFDRLSETTRRRLDAAFSATRLPEMPETLRGALIALGDDPFVGWRYVYEGRQRGALDKVLLDRVIDTLGKVAEGERRHFEARNGG